MLRDRHSCQKRSRPFGRDQCFFQGHFFASGGNYSTDISVSHKNKCYEYILLYSSQTPGLEFILSELQDFELDRSRFRPVGDMRM